MGCPTCDRKSPLPFAGGSASVESQLIFSRSLIGEINRSPKSRRVSFLSIFVGKDNLDRDDALFERDYAENPALERSLSTTSGCLLCRFHGRGVL